MSVTIYEIAARAGVSSSTVARVLRGDTKGASRDTARHSAVRATGGAVHRRTYRHVRNSSIYSNNNSAIVIASRNGMQRGVANSCPRNERSLFWTRQRFRQRNFRLSPNQARNPFSVPEARRRAREWPCRYSASAYDR